MKIAYVLDSYPSATETFLAREIEALRQLGVSIEVFALHAGQGAVAVPLPRRWVGAVEKLLTGPERLHYWTAAGRSLASLDAFRDVTHVHAAWASHPAAIARAAADAAGLTWSFFGHARDLWVEGGDLAGKVESATFAASCTRAGVQRIRAGDPGVNILYAPHGLDLSLYDWREWRPGPTKRLLGVGRLVEKKGWDTLIESLSDIDLPGVELEIIGEGPARTALEKKISQRGLEGVVHMPGAESESAVRQAMVDADCLVLPSRVAADGDRDGLANVLLEGAALGLPLVTTDAGAARDLVDESTGRLAWRGDAANLAATIGAVFEEPEITLARCRAARIKVEQEFDVQRNVRVLATAFGFG